MPPASSRSVGVPTKRASAVALEAFTEAALAARRHPRRRVLLGLALSALRDDPADALGLLTAHRDLAAAGGGRRRWLALPPPDPGVLNHAVEDDPGGVVVLLLRGLRWRLSRQVVPRLGAPARPRHALAAGEGWDRTAGPQLGLSARQPALEQAAKRLLRWDPRRPGSAGGRQGHLAAASAQAAAGRRRGRLRGRRVRATGAAARARDQWTFQQRHSPC